MKAHILFKLVSSLAIFAHAACSDLPGPKTLDEFINTKFEEAIDPVITLDQMIELFSIEEPRYLPAGYFGWFRTFSETLVEKIHCHVADELKKKSFPLNRDTQWWNLFDSIIDVDSDDVELKAAVIMSFNWTILESTARYLAQDPKFGRLGNLYHASSEMDKRWNTGGISLSKDLGLSPLEELELVIRSEVYFGPAKEHMGDNDKDAFVKQLIGSFSQEKIIEALPGRTILDNLPAFVKWAAQNPEPTSFPQEVSYLTLIKGIQDFSSFENSQIIASPDCRAAFFTLLMKNFVSHGESTLSVHEFSKLASNGVVDDICNLAISATEEGAGEIMHDAFIMAARFPLLARIGNLCKGKADGYYWEQALSELGFSEKLQISIYNSNLFKDLVDGLKKEAKTKDKLRESMTSLVSFNGRCWM